MCHNLAYFEDSSRSGVGEGVKDDFSVLSNWKGGVDMRCFAKDCGRSRFQCVLGVGGKCGE